jgi:hypothetical protein
MHRRLLPFALALIVAAPAAAQAPDGWSVRVDRSQSATDPDDTPNLKVTTVGKGFRVTGGPAGTFWNPANTTGTGDFTARAAFTLMKPSGHVNYYGLIFGGSDLGGANQTYIYFLVAQNGTFTIRHRAGESVMDINARAANAAVVQPGADGQSKNALEVRVAGNTISYVVNGTVVHTTPRSGMTAKTDGLVGVRINHQLDVQVDGFEVMKR